MKLLHYGQPCFAPVDDASGGGAGAGSAAVFDQAAFSTAILGEVTKLFGAFGKNLKADLAKQMAAATPAAVVVDPEPAIDPATGVVKPPSDPALAAQLRVLERRNKELADQFTAMKTESDATKANADKKEQDATVRTRLNKYKFADEQAAEDAFEIFSTKVKRNEDGGFVGNDGTPLDQFLEEGIRVKQYLLAPKEVAGAGARGGGRMTSGKAIDIDNIKPGMSNDDLALVTAEITAVLAGR